MSDELSIAKAVEDLSVITAEIRRLRDAVARHKESAEGLDAVAGSLGNLAEQLELLPVELKAQFAGVAETISHLEAALRPAGKLETAVQELVARNETLLRDLLAERDELKGQLAGIREENAVMQREMDELQKLAGR